MVAAVAAVAGRGAATAGTRAAPSTSAFGKTSNVNLKGEALKQLKELFPIPKTLKGVLSKVSKVVSILEKASPALKQQMIVMNKAFGLFLRPIGDILAKFVRPMAIWMIKFAMKWYQLFGGGGTGDNKQSLEDKKATLEESISVAESMGDEDLADRLKDDLADIEEALDPKSLKDATDESTSAIGLLGKGISNAWDAAAPWLEKGAKFAWEKIKEGGTGVWDALKNIDQGIGAAAISLWDNWTIFGKKPEELWTMLKDSWSTVKNWAKDLWGMLKGGWTGVKEWSKALWKYAIVPGWEGVKNWSKDIWNDYIVAGWAGVKDWATDLWNMLSSAFSKLVDKIVSWRPWNSGDDEEGSGAVGIANVQKSGLYQLHAGETVIPAGDTTRMTNNSSNVVINNHFNIPATINSDIDIKELVRKIAEEQEVQLRRRVSYI